MLSDADREWIPVIEAWRVMARDALRENLKLQEQVAELLPWAEIGAHVFADEYPYIDEFASTGSEFLARIEAGEFQPEPHEGDTK
jgi:hypothetical protein